MLFASLRSHLYSSILMQNFINFHLIHICYHTDSIQIEVLPTIHDILGKK